MLLQIKALNPPPFLLLFSPFIKEYIFNDIIVYIICKKEKKKSHLSISYKCDLDLYVSEAVDV